MSFRQSGGGLQFSTEDDGSPNQFRRGMMRVLAGYYRSSAAYCVRIALNLKSLSVEYSFVHLRKGEQRGEAHLSLNPAGLVPVWSETGMTLTQSLAIIAYLDEVYSNPPLLPTDIQLRAYVRETALMVACDIHPIGNLRVLDNLAHDYKAGAEELRTGIVIGSELVFQRSRRASCRQRGLTL